MSAGIMEIHLKDVIIYGYHGLHAGEEILGGKFKVDLTATYLPQQLPVKEIKQTIDYTVLLFIVKQRMLQPTGLLETLATEIAGEIMEKFSTVIEVVISIIKLNPPIENFEGSVGVTFKMKKG